MLRAGIPSLGAVLLGEVSALPPNPAHPGSHTPSPVRAVPAAVREQPQDKASPPPLKGLGHEQARGKDKRLSEVTGSRGGRESSVPQRLCHVYEVR